MKAISRPQLVGKLETLPLAELLVLLLDRRATGTLVLEEPGGRKSALYSHQGQILKAYGAGDSTPSVDPREALCQKLETAASLPAQTVYGFYADTDHLHQLPSVAGDPLGHIWRCARHSVDPIHLNRALESLGEQRLILHRNAELQRFGFSNEELAALEPILSGRYNFNDLISDDDADAARICSIVYALAICRHFDFDGRVEPVGLAANLPPPSIHRGSVRPGPRERQSRGSSRPYTSSLGQPRSSGSRQRHLKLKAKSIPPRRNISTRPPALPSDGLIRVPSDTATNIKRLEAGLRNTSSIPVRYPPGALPRASAPSISPRTKAPGMPSRRAASPQEAAANSPGVTSTHKRLVQPHQHLCDSSATAGMTSSNHDCSHTVRDASGISRSARPSDADRPSVVAGPRDPEAAWRKAEFLSKKGNHSGALRALRGIGCPGASNPSRAAFFGYLKARDGATRDDEMRDYLTLCTKAMLDAPEEPKYVFYRAWINRLLGREKAALKDFLDVSRRDQANVDAAREVHLARMRQSARANSGGLMERLRRSLGPNPTSAQAAEASTRPSRRYK